MSDTVVLLFCVPLLVLTLWSLWLRLPSLGLIDIFFLAFAMYFGAYTIVDVLVNGTEWIDAEIAAIMLGGLCLSAAATWLYAKHAPSWVLRETSLQRLKNDWAAASGTAIAIVILGGLALRLYTAATFDFEAFDRTDYLGRELPYWYTSVLIIARWLIFGAAIAAFGKVIAYRGRRRLAWIVLFAIGTLVILGQGRGAMIAYLILIGWTVISETRRKWIAVLLIASALPVVVILSNLHQTYRSATFMGVPLSTQLEVVDTDSIFESAIAFEKTTSNLEVRMAIWRHNYEVVDAFANGRGSTQFGTLFLYELQNYVPYEIYPWKETFDAESVLLNAVQIFETEADRPTNAWAFVIGDFGLFGIFLGTLMVPLFVYLCASVMRRLRDPFIRAILMGFALGYANSIEINYTTPIHIARDFIIAALAYTAIKFMWRVCYTTLRMAVFDPKAH